MIDTSFLSHLDRFALILNKRVTSSYVGTRASTMIGRGLIFKDHQIYSPGDDYRSIDWRVYARSDDLFIKRYEEERNLTIHIIIDFSASMGFGERKKKNEFASQIAIGFAYMALKNNERFVISTFSDSLHLFKPRKGRKQLAQIVEYLNKLKPQGTSLLQDSLHRYKNMIGSKSMIIIISDFLYDVEEVKKALGRYKNHEIKLIQVLDKQEANLTLNGDFRLRDLESNQMMRTFISPLLRKKYHTLLSEHQAKLQRVADELTARFYAVSTDMPVFDAFYKIFMT